MSIDLASVLLAWSQAPETATAAYNCLSAPEVVAKRRTEAINELTTLSEKLRGRRQLWVAALPPESPAIGINFPLISALATSIDYPDKDLVRDLATGMPIVGGIPECGTLTKWPRPATTSMQKWRKTIPERNAAAIKRVKGETDMALLEQRWSKTNAEAAKGWVAPPQPPTRAVIDTRPLTPRYAIREKHGNQAGKIRLIDDFSASGISSILTTGDASSPENLDSFLAGVMQFKKLAPGCVIKAFSVDFAHAYKHVPLVASQHEFATIVFADTNGDVFYSTLRTQPFGSRRPPANWGQVTAFSKWLMSRLFACSVKVCVDDCFATEPEATIESVFNSLLGVCELLGLAIEHTKTTKHTDQLLLLGDEIRIAISDITAKLPDRKELTC